jgi:hypothetical protein
MRPSMLRRLRIRHAIAPACACVLTLALAFSASPLARAATKSPDTVIGGITIPQTPTNRPAKSQTVPRFKTPASALPQAGDTGTASTPALSTPSSSTAAPAGTVTNKAGAITGPTTGATTPTIATGTPTTTAPAGTPTTTAVTPTTTAPSSPATSGRPLVSRRTSSGPTHLSPWAIVAAAFAVLLILASLVWGAVRWYAYEPRWGLSLRHALEEAGLRLGATWAEFADWAKLGH